MSIVSHFVKLDPPERDGSGERYATYVYEFHNGEFLQRTYRRPASGFDYEAEADSLVAEFEQRMIDDEVARLVEYFSVTEKLTDPLVILPVHPETDSDLIRQRRFRRKLLKRWIRETDIKKVRRVVYPIWYWLKFTSGYTAQQIADYLGVSLGVLSAFDDRFQAYHDNLAFIDAEVAMDWGD